MWKLGWSGYACPGLSIRPRPSNHMPCFFVLIFKILPSYFFFPLYQSTRYTMNTVFLYAKGSLATTYSERVERACQTHILSILLLYLRMLCVVHLPNIGQLEDHQRTRYDFLPGRLNHFRTAVPFGDKTT